MWCKIFAVASRVNYAKDEQCIMHTWIAVATCVPRPNDPTTSGLCICWINIACGVLTITFDPLLTEGLRRVAVNPSDGDRLFRRSSQNPWHQRPPNTARSTVTPGGTMLSSFHLYGVHRIKRMCNNLPVETFFTIWMQQLNPIPINCLLL